ncbi:VOC family protein [Bacillus sp. JJ722]|uniref:VOC family protein n=1 Tax=Bacillus sp. JJ722 TaxID=3122973 RepID=UPI002FFFC8F5
MGRVVHFEIHVNNMEQAKTFYGEIFGWTFQDWSDYAGMPYFGAMTGSENELGINGALMQRQSASDYDVSEAKILKLGGKVAKPKHALPGMAWQGYYFDTEGNIFGLHQPDVNAK